jgi:glycosyltransferase involved in cell wall biosynthesis
MALLEAMAAGVPAAVTAVGGNPEIVLDGATGWTVPSGDVDALARVMRSAVTSDEPRGSYAGAGRSRYTEHFTVQRMIESYRVRYLRLLETMPGRPEAS